MQKKLFFVKNIKNLLVTMLFFQALFCSVSCNLGFDVIVGDERSVLDDVNDGRTTAFTFYEENPIINPRAKNVTKRYLIGSDIKLDDIDADPFFSKELRPGFISLEWFFCNPEDASAEIPRNVHTENNTVKVKSVSVATEPISFYAGKWVSGEKIEYTVRHLLQRISEDSTKGPETITSGGKMYYTYYEPYEKDETKSDYPGEITQAQFATTDLIPNIENYKAANATINQKVIAENGSTVVEIYYDVKPITVTLDPNGGTGSPINQTFYTETDCITIQAFADLGFEKEGCEFTGWNTNKDGFGSRYEDCDVLSPTEQMTLYAQWRDLQQQLVEETGSVDFSLKQDTTTISNGDTITAGSTLSFTVTDASGNPISSGATFSITLKQGGEIVPGGQNSSGNSLIVPSWLGSIGGSYEVYMTMQIGSYVYDYTVKVRL